MTHHDEVDCSRCVSLGRLRFGFVLRLVLGVDLSVRRMVTTYPSLLRLLLRGTRLRAFVVCII